ncbi:hypothetical protein ScPMuIL_008917 [Solemya velum]
MFPEKNLLLYNTSNDQKASTDQKDTGLSVQRSEQTECGNIDVNKANSRNRELPREEEKTVSTRSSSSRHSVRRKLDILQSPVSNSPVVETPVSAQESRNIVIDLSLEDEDEFKITIGSNKGNEKPEKCSILSSTPVVKISEQNARCVPSVSALPGTLECVESSSTCTTEQYECVNDSESGTVNALEVKRGSICKEMDGSLSRNESTKQQEKIPCPVCGVTVRSQVMNLHLDYCLAAKDKKISLRSAAPKRKPLPKVVYNIMSDKDIRKRLKEAGLSSQGNRKVLVKRHHDYLLAYNAECDSLNPRPVETILKELQKNEKMCSNQQDDCHSDKRLNIHKKSDAIEVERAQRNYVRKHKSQFDSLIREARSRMKKKSTPKEYTKCTVQLDSNSAVEKATDYKRTEQIHNYKHNGKDLQVQVDENNLDCNSSNNDSCATSEDHIKNSSLTKKKNLLTPTASSDDRFEKSPAKSQNIDFKNILGLPKHLVSPGTEIMFVLPNELASPRNTAKANRHYKKKTNEKSRNCSNDENGIQKAGLLCDVTSSSKMKHSFGFSGSPSKHVFVDDSASEAGSEVGLIQKINSSINSFESEEIDNSLCMLKYERLWPALTATSRKERTRHDSESGSSDTSDILQTADEIEELTSLARPTRRSCSSTSDLSSGRSNCNRRPKRPREETTEEVPTKKRK